MKGLEESIIGLYRKCSTDLPKDVEDSIRNAFEKSVDETEQKILSNILDNIKIARIEGRPICQDTGTPIFNIKRPSDLKEDNIRKTIIDATRKATVNIPLRPNAIDPVTGENSSNNIGKGMPIIYFEEYEGDTLIIDLMLKGGGSENASILYKLPCERINAERDIEGVVKCVLDAAVVTQGKACSPTIIGVCIGGLSDTSITHAKKQLIRKINDKNPDDELLLLEEELTRKINSLGIGPMGLGGNASCLAVKVGTLARHPASFFVAVSFMCWAVRRVRLETKEYKAYPTQ